MLQDTPQWQKCHSNPIDGDSLLAPKAQKFSPAFPWLHSSPLRMVPCGSLRRNTISLIFVCCLLCGLYVLVQIRVLENIFPSTKYVQPCSWAFEEESSSTARHSQRHSQRHWLLDTEGCRIPAHQPFSKDVASLVFDYPTIVCADPPPLVRSNDTHLWVETDLMAKYNVSDLTCCFTEMWRHKGPTWQDNLGPKGPLEDSIQHGNDIRFGKQCTPFQEAVAVPFEFVRITCSSGEGANATQIFKDYHGFVPDKRPRGHAGPTRTQEWVSEDALNVLIVGIDSLSRLNFIRKMPRTRAFLEGRLGAQPMLGYNKVEDNTFPNLVPMLTGMTVPELREACWPNHTTHFDACPWVWKEFNREGYVNMFAEDTAWMGLFHYLKRGFANQPTDYDPRPVLYLGERELGRGGGFNAQYCIGQRHQLEVLFDYGARFARAMTARGRKFFGLVWGTSLSHDLLNQPDEADLMYEQFLADLTATGLLNRTAVIFMSDHGLRFGNILKTYQGHLENMLPVMYFVLPDWVRCRYPIAMRNLEVNRRRLVTLFDLHETFYNFMDLGSLADTGRARSAVDGVPRGISLFSPIPATRTCDMAGIPVNYCSCQHLSRVALNDTDVQLAASFVVLEMNSKLRLHRNCGRVAVDEVLEARLGQPIRSPNLKAEADEKEIQVMVRTQPGAALYMATVRQHVKTGLMQLAGSISRLNAYGNTSWCVDTTALKPLCFCTLPRSR